MTKKCAACQAFGAKLDAGLPISFEMRRFCSRILSPEREYPVLWPLHIGAVASRRHYN